MAERRRLIESIDDALAWERVEIWAVSGEATERITEDQCVAQGGHCFESDGITLTSNPPQYPETCKHCGKRRIATPQPSMSYRDVI